MAVCAEESLGILFSDVARLFWRRLEAAFAAAGLDFTSGEARVMVTLVAKPGLRQNRLADCLHIEPMTLCGFLERLDAKGMIERVADPVDRRAKLVSPTPAGRDMVDRLMAVSAEVKQAMADGLDEADTEVLRRLLERVRANLAALDPVACPSATPGTTDA